MRNRGITFAAHPPADWTPRIILLNGPRHVGKDSIAKLTQRAFGGLMHEKFSRPLKAAVCGAFGLDARRVEEMKDQPIYGDHTYRQLQIDLAVWLRSTYGSRLFSEQAADRLLRNWKRMYKGVVFSDCRFLDEAIVLGERLPRDRMVIIRVHRGGCSWDGDVGCYIDASDVPGVPVFDVHNDLTVPDAVRQMKDLILAHDDAEYADEPDRRDE